MNEKEIQKVLQDRYDQLRERRDDVSEFDLPRAKHTIDLRMDEILFLSTRFEVRICQENVTHYGDHPAPQMIDVQISPAEGEE